MSQIELLSGILPTIFHVIHDVLRPWIAHTHTQPETTYKLSEPSAL